MKKEASQATTEAMNLLQSTKRYYVEAGRYVAVQILLKRNPYFEASRPFVPPTEPDSVNSFAVRMTMEALGLMEGYRGKYHWTGTVMKSPDLFATTGTQYSYTHSDPETGRSVHERSVHNWKLREGAVTARVFLPTSSPAILALQAEGQELRAAVQEEYERLHK